MVEQPSYAERETLEFERGNFLTKIGPALTPDVPGLFPRLPDDAPRNRLTLAKWFFSPDQPLNRTYGGEPLLGATFRHRHCRNSGEFRECGRRAQPSGIAGLARTSLSKRSSLGHEGVVTRIGDQRDLPAKRKIDSGTHRERSAQPVCWRVGPQQRLTAEMVRDQALLASGFLSDTMGGPPVMPPQPEGVWNSVYNDSKWVDAKGPDRYRRAIYTYIKRTSGYPSFLTFDASDHDVSLARRIPTNTPLQALVTLNDPVYQEASEALARRMLKATRYSWMTVYDTARAWFCRAI